jgi:hypothetical protein
MTSPFRIGMIRSPPAKTMWPTDYLRIMQLACIHAVRRHHCGTCGIGAARRAAAAMADDKILKRLDAMIVAEAEQYRQNVGGVLIQTARICVLPTLR